MYNKVFRARTTTSNKCLLDFCDGQLFKEHPLFGKDNSALQLVVYFDEVEVANPLGSYKGYHKLGIVITIMALKCINLLFTIGLFYYILGNIEPKLRSSLKNIQLIACVTSPLLQEYGFEKVLHPFICDSNKLTNVSITYTCAI